MVLAWKVQHGLNGHVHLLTIILLLEIFDFAIVKIIEEMSKSQFFSQNISSHCVAVRKRVRRESFGD